MSRFLERDDKDATNDFSYPCRRHIRMFPLVRHFYGTALRFVTTVNDLIFLINPHILFTPNVLMVCLNRDSRQHYFFSFKLWQYVKADDVFTPIVQSLYILESWNLFTSLGQISLELSTSKDTHRYIIIILITINDSALTTNNCLYWKGQQF
jgi:hypothetical protein